MWASEGCSRGEQDGGENKPWASLEYSSNLPGFFKSRILGRYLEYHGLSEVTGTMEGTAIGSREEGGRRTGESGSGRGG